MSKTSIAVVRAGEIANIIKSEGSGAGEGALVEIAERDGEHAARAIVAHLDPASLLHMVRSHDYTKNTAVSDFVTPTHAAEALRLEARFWDGPTIERFPEVIQESVKNTLCAMVLSTESTSRRRAFINAIAQTPWGMTYLSLVFCDRPAFLRFVRTGSFEETVRVPGEEPDLDDDTVVFESREDQTHEIPHGDWEELALVVKIANRALLEQIVKEMKRAVASQHDDAMPSDGKIATRSLIRRARGYLTAQEVGSGEEILDSMFKPLA